MRGKERTKMSIEIYDSSRNELESLLFQMERLQEQGFNLGKLPDQTFRRLIELIDNQDQRRLAELRLELLDHQSSLMTTEEIRGWSELEAKTDTRNLGS